MKGWSRGLVVIALLCFSGYGDAACDRTWKLKDGSKSAVLQRFMNCWGTEVEKGKVDLVILLDTSGSVQQSGYLAGRTFIKALLKNVRIAFDATRIAIISFAWKSRIDINYLWNPDRTKHKCKFVQDFKKVKFTRGLTNLRGALNDVYTIFSKLINEPTTNFYRPNANKVVMLLSDGKGNIDEKGRVNPFTGNDVTAEMRRIRSFGEVEVYSVAVTNETDQTTLRDKVATIPSFFMYQPDEQALVEISRFIRGDPHEKDYEMKSVDASDCDDPGCDKMADCGCNLLSGNYKCACRRGYHGTGEKRVPGSSCYECPVDTYGSKAGMVVSCTPCPPNSGTQGKKKQLQRGDCKCNSGYEGNPGRYQECKIKTCNGVYRVPNGYVANKAECDKKEFGTKCIFRCNENFKMMGNDVVQCNENRRWVGDTPECKRLGCKEPTISASQPYTQKCHGIVDQETGDMSSGSICDYECKSKFYHAGGSKKRYCRETQQWNGTDIECREITCRKIPRNNDKLTAKNLDCFKSSLKIDEQCEFECSDEFLRIGPKSMTCKKGKGAIGVWEYSGSSSQHPSCVDTKKPVFEKAAQCEKGIPLVNETEPGQSYGWINFDAIGVTDNSGTVIVTSDPPGNELGRPYKFQITPGKLDKTVTFTAKDPSGNEQVCRFLIRIIDKEPPRNLACPRDQTITTSERHAKADWTLPTYSDNCGDNTECLVKITSTYYPNQSLFPLGESREVRYTAEDPSENKNFECTFRITVQESTCKRLRPPRFGMLIMHGPTVALPGCQQGRKPEKKFPILYTCGNSGWTSLPPSPGPVVVPDCVEKSPPTGVTEETILYFTYTGDCNSAAVKAQAKDHFLKSGLCFACQSSGIEVFCGDTTVVNRRRRSNMKQLGLRVTLKVATTREEAKRDPTASKLRTKLTSVVTPQFLSSVRKEGNWKTKVDSHIQSLARAYSENNPKKTCGNIAEAFDASANVQVQCTVCPAGKFKNLATGSCQKCAHGSYQPNEGSTSCITCPDGSTTIGNDLKNMTSCRKLCKPGEYSENGLSPCTASPPGTYTEGYRQTSSKPCPSGTTTVTPGATSRYTCGTKCQPGTYSKTGVEPCTPCEQGSYQNLIGRLNCIDCPGLTWTYGEGANSLSACTDINSCASNPCLSGGHCVDLKVGFRCECRSGYFGKRCEKEVDECALKPCLNGGNCLDKFGGYLCVCPEGATGQNCEILVGICKSGVCGSNGDCTDLSDNSFKCVCNDGYTGPFCETYIDQCQSQPCQNDANASQASQAKLVGQT